MNANAVLTTLLAAGLAAPAFAGDWKVDSSHVTAQFSVKHMMVSTVRGQFDKVSGKAVLDDADLTKSSVEIMIEAASVNTREPKRDEHLRSPDFFDVAKFPTIQFKSTKIEKLGAGKYRLLGNLTMRGVTKPVSLEVEGPTDAIKNPWGGLARGVSVTGKLNRKDWGLVWNKALEAGGVLVGEEIQLQIDLELNPA